MQRLTPQEIRWLNSQPKALRAKTTPELRKVFELKVPVEKEKNINRSSEEVLNLLQSNKQLNELLNYLPKNGLYGTADGAGLFGLKFVIQNIAKMAKDHDIEFILLYHTMWNNETKTWIPLSEIKLF